MNPFSIIWSAYLRWRHSKGFGVHSPFAFALVNDAVRPGIYGYYGYELINSVILLTQEESYPRINKDACLLLRLLVALTPQRLYIGGDDLYAFRAAAIAAGIPLFLPSETPPYPRKGDFLLIKGDTADWAETVTLLRKGVTVMTIDSPAGLKECVENAIERGTVFSGTRISLAVPREEMALVKYTMQF